MVVAAAEWSLTALRVASAVAFLVVAAFLLRRQVSGAAVAANRAFALWWGLLGLVGIIGLVLEHGPNLAHQGLETTLAVIYVYLVILYTALGGLLYYLLFVYTGRPGWLWVVAAFYVGLTIYTVLLVQLQDPFIGPGDDGELGLELANEWGPRHPASIGFSLALILPPLAAAAAYFMLFFRVDDATAKYRILLVSGGIVLWFGFSLVGLVAGAASGEAEQSMAQQIISQSLGLAAAGMVLAAYVPPGPLAKRYGLRSVRDEWNRP